MRLHLLNVLTVLSLLLCLAAAALWARSYFREDRVLWTPVDRGPRRITYRQWQFTCVRGRFHWEGQRGVVTDPGKLPFAHAMLEGIPPVEHYSRPGAFGGGFGTWSDHSFLDSLGFEVGSSSAKLFPPADTMTVSFVAVPLWAPVLAGAALPALRLWRWRRAERRRRAANRLCVRCGYDLRASPGRCPECGAEVSVSPPG